jgi:hypothetical protein
MFLEMHILIVHAYKFRVKCKYCSNSIQSNFYKIKLRKADIECHASQV